METYRLQLSLVRANIHSSIQKSESKVIEQVKHSAEPDPTALGKTANEEVRIDVVILVHGIRDFAIWQSTVGRALEKAGLKAEATNYGRLNLFLFLVPIPYFRNKAIETVWNQIRIVKKNYREDVRISVIAHSFGTYVVSHLIKNNFDIKFHKIIFCGSVVNYSFPFEQFQDRFSQPIINEVGTRDIWPAVAESVTHGYGSAGTYGFRRPLVKDRWHNGASHGYFLSAEFCRKFWIPYLKNDMFVERAAAPESPSFWVRLISIFKIKYILLLILTIALGVSFNLAKTTNKTSLRVDIQNINQIYDVIGEQPKINNNNLYCGTIRLNLLLAHLQTSVVPIRVSSVSIRSSRVDIPTSSVLNCSIDPLSSRPYGIVETDTFLVTLGGRAPVAKFIQNASSAYDVSLENLLRSKTSTRAVTIKPGEEPAAFDVLLSTPSEVPILVWFDIMYDEGGERKLSSKPLAIMGGT